MGATFYKQLRDILLAHDCEFRRQAKGSHEMWFSPTSGKTFSVPVTIVSRHTANGILKQAGINEKI